MTDLPETHPRPTEEMVRETELVGNNAPAVTGTTNDNTSAVVDTPTPVTAGTPSIEERILQGFNMPNEGIARELMTMLNSDGSPLQDPDPSRWLEFVSPHPGMRILGIPVDELCTEHRQLRGGLLVVLRRLPRPRSVTMLLQVIRSLRVWWPHHHLSIPTSATAIPMEMEMPALNTPETIVEHFVQHPINLNEIGDLTALFEYLCQKDWGV